ncbi:unnamed protein product [Prunus armeniaca]
MVAGNSARNFTEVPAGFLVFDSGRDDGFVEDGVGWEEDVRLIRLVLNGSRSNSDVGHVKLPAH